MTDNALAMVILEEVRALRSRFDLHSADTGERLSALETHVSNIVGDAQPGRMTLIENKVSDLQHWRWKATGIYIGVSGAVSCLTAYLFHLWK